MCQMVQALVDKYNEDHNLLEVCSPFYPHCVSCYHCCAVSYCQLVNVTIADLTHASYFRVLHTNSKTFYTTTQFVRSRNGTIISISLQRLKGLVQMNVTWTIFSLWKWNVCHKESLKNCLLTVSAQLIWMTMVLYTLYLKLSTVQIQLFGRTNFNLSACNCNVSLAVAYDLYGVDLFVCPCSMCATFIVLELFIIYNIKLVNAHQWLHNDFLLPLTLLCVCAWLVPLQLTLFLC